MIARCGAAPEGHRARALGAAAALADHPRHVLLAALVAGLLCGPRWPAAVVVLAAVALLGVPASPRRFAPLAAGVAVLVLLGAVVARERLRVLDRTALRPAPAFTVRGFAVDAVRTRSFGARVVPVRLTGGERVLVRVPSRIGLPALGIGDELIARGELRTLSEFESFERGRGVHAVLEADSVRRTGSRRRSPIDDLRRRAESGVTAGLPREQAALARGMVLGQDHALPDDLREALRVAGLSHLVAASGQNVMLLAALVIAAATAAGAMLRTRLALALLAVALYVPLAGAGPSIQRAGVMGAAGLVAALAGRPSSRWYALLLAAGATLAVNPRAAEDPGWQLSFAAVVAILALHQRLRDALTAQGSPRALAEAAALTITATLGTAPLLAYHFEQVSLVSLPANVLAAPAVAPIMWLGALAATAGGPAAEILNAVAALPLAYLAWLGRTAAAVPHAGVGLKLPGPLAVAGAYGAFALGGIALQRAARRPRVRVAAVVVVVAAVGAAAVAAEPPAPPPGFAFSVLDVGQGDAILVQHGSRAILVDTGPPGAGLVGELREAGLRRLDALLLTHSSRDHEGGLPEVLGAFRPDLVLDGRQSAEERAAEGDEGEGGGVRFEGLPDGAPRAASAAGQVLRAGPLRLTVLWPPADRSRGGDPNSTATVALVEDGATSALLTADAESAVTLPLDLPPVDILKVAHHGSADEGLPELLERLRPRVAVIPVGRNTYGHPAPETIEALTDAVPEVHRTDEEGTVRVDGALHVVAG